MRKPLKGLSYGQNQSHITTEKSFQFPSEEGSTEEQDWIQKDMLRIHGVNQARDDDSSLKQRTVDIEKHECIYEIL